MKTWKRLVSGLFALVLLASLAGSALAAEAAKKYAKILAKTIINPEGDAGNYGQNQFFYGSTD